MRVVLRARWRNSGVLRCAVDVARVSAPMRGAGRSLRKGTVAMDTADLLAVTADDLTIARLGERTPQYL